MGTRAAINLLDDGYVYNGFGNRLADGRTIGYKSISAIVPAVITKQSANL